MQVCEINAQYRDEVNRILYEAWQCPPIVSRGRLLDTTALPGFICLDEGIVKGIVTYHVENRECEIVTLNSLEENKGMGTVLIHAVIEAARRQACERVWLITTNDDIHAIRFYQRRGFDLKAAHINALTLSRRLKPGIPLIGVDGIRIRHELEFEMVLEAPG